MNSQNGRHFTVWETRNKQINTHQNQQRSPSSLRFSDLPLPLSASWRACSVGHTAETSTSFSMATAASPLALGKALDASPHIKYLLDFRIAVLWGTLWAAHMVQNQVPFLQDTFSIRFTGINPQLVLRPWNCLPHSVQCTLIKPKDFQIS